MSISPDSTAGRLVAGLVVAIGLAGGLALCAAKDRGNAGALAYRGCCSASAAVALNNQLFAVANDEDNQIRVYRRDQPSLPVTTVDLAGFLSHKKKDGEADFEGAARVGNRIYWTGSHSRNPDGKARPERHVFLATDLEPAGDSFALKPAGRPYRTLITDLAADARYQDFRLKEAEQLAPKLEGGLNIEGLCATGKGELLIGFRNPVPGGRALLAPLVNPNEVIQGQPARFGTPVLLPLDGDGIRDVAYADGKYYLLAGSFQGGGHPRLFEWDGQAAVARALPGATFTRFNAEALVIYPDTGASQIQLLSDDGGGQCAKQKDPNKRQFRSVWHRP
jgi:hypothetical protein